MRILFFLPEPPVVRKLLEHLDTTRSDPAREPPRLDVLPDMPKALASWVPQLPTPPGKPARAPGRLVERRLGHDRPEPRQRNTLLCGRRSVLPQGDGRLPALNPRHPCKYRPALSLDEHRRAYYRAAVDGAVKANLPDLFWTQRVVAAAHGQLGDLTAARKALDDLLAQRPDFAETGEELLAKCLESQMVEQMMEGLRRVGRGG